MPRFVTIKARRLLACRQNYQLELNLNLICTILVSNMNVPSCRMAAMSSSAITISGPRDHSTLMFQL